LIANQQGRAHAFPRKESKDIMATAKRKRSKAERLYLQRLNDRAMAREMMDRLVEDGFLPYNTVSDYDERSYRCRA
jgi:hypothetical protein